MTPSNDHLGPVQRAIESMKGHVIPEHDMHTALWLVDLLRTPVCQENVNLHLERNGQAQSIVGYFLAQANLLLKFSKTDLARVEASLYNGRRSAGEGRHGRPPSQKSLEMSVESDPQVAEHRGAAIRLEYYRDVLKEIRDAIHSRSRHLEQISNNLRLEGRIDAES